MKAQTKSERRIDSRGHAGFRGVNVVRWVMLLTLGAGSGIDVALADQWVKGGVPTGSSPATSLGYATYQYKYFVQPTIRRVNSRQSCRGEYNLAGVFSASLPLPDYLDPQSPTSVVMGYRSFGMQYGGDTCDWYTCGTSGGCPFVCQGGSGAPGTSLFNEAKYPSDRFWVSARAHGSTGEGNPSPQNFQFGALPSGLQRGGTAQFCRQWAYSWTCDNGAACDAEALTGGYFYGDTYKLRVNIQADPSFTPGSGHGAAGSGSAQQAVALFALGGEPGGCCGNAPTLNVGRLAYEPASGNNGVRGAALTYYGYDPVGSTMNDLYSFQIPGKVLLSNQTIPSEGWSTNLAITGTSFQATITDGDDYRYHFEATSPSSISRTSWASLQVSLTSITHGSGDDPVADFASTDGPGNGSFPDGTSRIDQQDDPNGPGCIKYIHDVGSNGVSRLAAVVACGDCSSNGCDPEQCDENIRRLDVQYDEYDRLVGWSGGCGSCGSVGQTITYGDYIPALGDDQPIRSRLDAAGNALVIYHYDEAHEVSAVFRGSDDANSNGYMIVKEVEDFITTNGVNTNGVSTNGVLGKYTKLYVDNANYEYIFEAYRNDGLIGARTVWSGLNGAGTAFTTRFVDDPDNNREVTVLPRGNYVHAYLQYGLVSSRVVSDGSTEKMQELFEYTTIRGAPYVSNATSPYGGVTAYQYDQHALLTHRWDPEFGDFGATTGKRSEVTYEYDDWLQLTKETRTIASGTAVETAYTYDTQGRMTQQVEDAASGGLNLTTTYAYNAFNDVTKVTDPRGVEKHSVYCTTGQLVQEYTLELVGGQAGSHALEERQYEYDSNGRLSKVKVADDVEPFTPGSPGGWFVTEYQYDTYGRRTKMIVEGELETTYEYDNQNRIVKTTTPGGVWTKIERDGRGLQTAQVIGSGEDEYLRTTYEYDANGNLTKIIEPSGRTTTYAYDLFDRKTQATVDGPE